MAGLKFSAFSQAARVSNLDIDMDLDMGVRSVIAAKGRFAEIDQMDENGIKFIAPVRLSKSVFTDTMVLPYTVTPSDNVLHTSTIAANIWSEEVYQHIGSIRLGPGLPNMGSYKVKWTMNILGSGWADMRVVCNGEVIATSERYEPPSPGTYNGELTLPPLSTDDVLTFEGRGKYGVDFQNFELCGTVTLHVIDAPIFEDVL